MVLRTMRQTLPFPVTVLIAGLAGGAAEIAWVFAYGAFAGVSATDVAREVTASLVPGGSSWAAAPALGVAIHLGLSVALAYAFVAGLDRLLPRVRGTARLVAIAVGALASVWAINFFVVLPLVNPRFVTLMPYAATFLSKALFGAAMGVVLARSAARRSG